MMGHSHGVLETWYVVMCSSYRLHIWGLITRLSLSCASQQSGIAKVGSYGTGMLTMIAAWVQCMSQPCIKTCTAVLLAAVGEVLHSVACCWPA